MKKVLPILMLLALFGLSKAFAQTVFDSASFENSQIPPGWTQTNSGSGHWVFGPWVSNVNFPANPHTNFAVISDTTCSCNDNPSTLVTSAMNLSAASTVLLKFDYLWEEWYNQTSNETFEVDFSTDGGSTWNANPLIYPNPVGSWTTITLNISAAVATNANVKIRFNYSDMGTEFPDGGLAIDNVSIYTPVAYDVSESSINIPNYVSDNSPFIVTGTFMNIGATPVTTLNMNYSVNGGPTVSQNLTGMNVPTLSSYSYAMNTSPYTPSANGAYTIKVWHNNIDGNNVDPTPANDTLTGSFTVIDTAIQKIVLIEEFNQASCDPCAEAAPNVDSVVYANYNIVAPIRYHVSWPGTDYMNAVPIVGSEVQTRVTYYNVSGVPDSRMDGSTDAYPGYDPNTVYLSSGLIQPEATKGSPYRISVTATYDGISQFLITSNIKCFATLPSGLIAYVVLTDSLHYVTNQSSESIAQYDFPEAMEQFLPTVSGTAVTALTAESNQALVTNWTQNHALATNALPYDSGQWRVVVFIQNPSTKYVYQATMVVPTLEAGIDEISNTVSTFSVYPNPFSGSANIAFTLKKSEDVTMEVYNLIGEKVYTNDIGSMTPGLHVIPFNSGDLAQGMYFITLRAGGNSVTQKVSILK
jgi:hypothetical protein